MTLLAFLFGIVCAGVGIWVVYSEQKHPGKVERFIERFRK